MMAIPHFLRLGGVAFFFALGSALASPAIPPSVPASATHLTEEQVRGWLAVEAARNQNPRKHYSWEEFLIYHQTSAYKANPYYLAEELDKFDPHVSPIDPVTQRPVRFARGPFDDIQSDGVRGLVRHFKIRATYDDVLTSEDPTAAAFDTAATPPQGVSDLTGATFSYSRDLRAGTDTWLAKGAVIVPFSGVREQLLHEPNPFLPHAYGFAPSVTFDRKLGGADPTQDEDSLIFRLGAYGKWLDPLPGLTSLTLRAYGTYGTDFGFHKEIPVAETELEPVFTLGPALGVGSRHAVFRTSPTEKKGFALTNVSYQFRAILHAQYGRVTNAAGLSRLHEDEDFLRVGPRLKLRLDPLFTPKLTCDVAYDYQGDLVGHSRNHGLLTVAPALVLNKLPEDAVTLDAPLIKLQANYQNGGLDLTKERVHTFLVGLGVTY